MKKILNYKCTKHFEDRIRRRRIEPFLISMCLAKGKLFVEKKKRKRFVLSKEQILSALEQEYIKATDYRGLVSIVVIARGNILITAFGKYGDTGISHILSL